jgi:hypothetical protein
MRPACPHTSSFFHLNSTTIRAKNELSETNLNHLKHDCYLFSDPK